jgi:Outer membrane protein beta-barrel domain
MRIKLLLTAAVLSFFAGLGSLTATAQVAAAAHSGGLPIGFGVGMSGYYLDYSQNRWMEGPVVWANVRVFRGFGIDASARSIFMNTPASLTRMQQNTFLGGVYYEGPKIWRVRPYARFGAGLGTIEFPSHNPLYTRDSYMVTAPSGGIEIPVSYHIAIRTEYEYQFWKDYQGPRYLNPQGPTVGVKYYLRGRNFHMHADAN